MIAIITLINTIIRTGILAAKIAQVQDNALCMRAVKKMIKTTYSQFSSGGGKSPIVVRVSVDQ